MTLSTPEAARVFNLRAPKARFTGFSDCQSCGGTGPCAACEDDLSEIEFLNTEAGQDSLYRDEMFTAISMGDAEMDAMLDEMFLANDPIECLDADGVL